MEKNKKGFVENLFYPDCMRTSTGIYLNILNPTVDMFDIEDIAHALSQIPRFGGHLPIFYPISEHCISVAEMAQKDGFSKSQIFNCLMHDASEAYICDIVTPVKRVLSNYYEVEKNLMKIISEKFNFNFENVDYVKHYDELQLKHEWRIMIGEYLPVEKHWKTSKEEFLNVVNYLLE